MDSPVSWKPRAIKSKRALKKGQMVLTLFRGNDVAIPSSSLDSDRWKSSSKKTTLGKAIQSLTTAWSGAQAWRRGNKPRGYMILLDGLLGGPSPYLYTKPTRQSDGEYVGCGRWYLPERERYGPHLFNFVDINQKMRQKLWQSSGVHCNGNYSPFPREQIKLSSSCSTDPNRLSWEGG